MIVLKFGGKSLENRFESLAKYTKSRAEKEKVVVVVSAIGSTTDNLLSLARSRSKLPNPRELDSLLSTGETASASLFSLKLNDLGVKSVSLQGFQANIQTRGDFGHSLITYISKAAILKKLSAFDCVVVAGFQGINKNGDVTTLGRGGSDTTAVALGATLDCPVEIFSDFDGIFAGDPRQDNFIKYDHLDYDSAQKYSHRGAKVLCGTSADLAKQYQVDLVCKSSKEPNLTGTRISSKPAKFLGMNIRKDLCEIDLMSNNTTLEYQKSVKYLLKKPVYKFLRLSENEISLLVDQENAKGIQHELAKINHLLKEPPSKE